MMRKNIYEPAGGLAGGSKKSAEFIVLQEITCKKGESKYGL